MSKGPVAADKATAAVLAGQLSPRAVAGLDTAANRLHLYCDNGLVASHTCPKSMKNPDDRRHQLYTQARRIFGLLPVGTLLVVEEPLALQNGETTRLLGMAAGATWAAHLDFPVFWAWVNVSTWKKEIVGKGNVDKEQIMAWVQANHQQEFVEEDFYDAFCICLWGKQALARVSA